ARARIDEARPDAPPELVAIVAKATMTKPDRRFESARELHDALQRYLAGDRDTEMRRGLAEEHAKAALSAARDARLVPSSSDEARRRAMREVSQALAFDPKSAAALRALATLVTEMPDEPPVEVVAEIEQQRRRSRSLLGRTMSLAAC